MFYVLIGAIPVIEGHFSSPTLPLLPTGTLFECTGDEETLSECRIDLMINTGGVECIHDDAGVVCQG